MSYDKLKGGFKSANGSRTVQQSNGYSAGLNDGSVKGKSLGSNHHELEPFFGLLRTDLQEVRIIQTNLVFLNGLDAKLSKEEVISESFMSEK